MLTLRLQRTGRKKLAQYRLIAQEHTASPTSGKVSAFLGSYDPHTKKAELDKAEIERHLKNGAQPSNRVAILLKKEGIKLPDWVTIKTKEAKKVEEPAAEEEVSAEKPAEEAQDTTEDEKSEDTEVKDA